jgi:hypothetical protein
MDTKPINPLIKHFRRPAIHFKLPSDGKYWPENTLDLPVTGEIPVYPMTSADEITLKTPDALMNGSGIVSVIQSCCPNILDAWKMPSIDVDAVLIAIRIASYGSAMTISTVCPHCNAEHDYDVDLGELSSQAQCPNYSRPVEYEGLKIQLRPQQYFGVTRNNIVQFEERRITDTLADSTIDEDVKDAMIKESMKKLLELNDQMLVDSTDYIETEDGVRVKDPEFIKEFYKNAESSVSRSLQQRLSEFAKEAELPKTKLACTSCGDKYEVPLEFDYSRFFDLGS